MPNSEPAQDQPDSEDNLLLGGASSASSRRGTRLASPNQALASSLSEPPARSRGASSASSVAPPPYRAPFSGRTASFATRKGHEAGEVDSPLLNKFIKECKTWEDLSVVVGKYSSQFNFIHVAAALTHLAQLKSASVDASVASLKHATPCMLSTVAVSSISDVPAHAWPMCPEPTRDDNTPSPAVAPPSCSPQYQELMHTLLNLTAFSMHQFGARQATNTMWALAHLAPHPGCEDLVDEMLPNVRSLLPWCEPQHLANSIWAVARTGLAPDDAFVEEFLVYSERAMPVGRIDLERAGE